MPTFFLVLDVHPILGLDFFDISVSLISYLKHIIRPFSIKQIILQPILLDFPLFYEFN